MIFRGEIRWADLPEPQGSDPGFPRPVLIIQENTYNGSELRTVICAAITSRLALAKMDGNVLITPDESGLPHDSVVNVTQLITVDKSRLGPRIGVLPDIVLFAVDNGLRRVQDL